MVAPKKEKLEYFPMDIDFFDDPKILLIEDKFGEKGELIAVKLLCWIYRNGYFCEWNNDVSLVFAKKNFSNIRAELCNDVVTELVRRGFFDKAIFDSFGVLTSKGIQERWLNAIKKCKRTASINSNFDLINSNYIEFLPNIKEETTVSLEETTVSLEETRRSKINKKNTPPLKGPPKKLGGGEAAGGGWGDFFKKLEESPDAFSRAWQDFFSWKAENEGFKPRDKFGYKKEFGKKITAREPDFCSDFYLAVTQWREFVKNLHAEEQAKARSKETDEQAHKIYNLLPDSERMYMESLAKADLCIEGHKIIPKSLLKERVLNEIKKNKLGVLV